MIDLKINKNRFEYILNKESRIEDVVKMLNAYAKKVVLIEDELGKLIGIMTDGDIRRGLISGFNLLSPIHGLMKKKPLVVTGDVSSAIAYEIMLANKINHLPVVNQEGLLIGIHQIDHSGEINKRLEHFVIMAGGKGTRLWPYTQNCPKPMLPVNGKPMLQHIVERARGEGFQRFVFAINYLGQIIEDHFGNGASLGVEIEYLKEDQPLGTAGALSLLSQSQDIGVIITNGDVLTDVKYGDILDFHKRHEAKATMAVRLYEWQHPFGVVRTNGLEIVGFEEKPVTKTYINAGIYILEPEILELIPKNTPCDMPELFIKGQNYRVKTMAYPMHEPWLDIGRPCDFEKANLIETTNFESRTK